MSPPSERGELDRGSLARLLIELHAARYDGALILTRDTLEKSFLFHEGAPVHAESNRASESLGRQLREAGVLTPADCARLETYVLHKACPEAKALLALSLLDSKALFLALKNRVRRLLVDCFGWDAGRFELQPDVAAPDGAGALAGNLPALVQEGIETHWSPEQILAELGPQMALYPAPTPALATLASRLALDESVESLLAGLGGERTLWQLLQGAAPRALASAWVLCASGVLEAREAPSAAQPEAQPSIEIVVNAVPSAVAPARGPAPKRESATAAAANARAGEARARDIAERFERLEALDHYALLGIERDADDAALKAAYLAAAKAYHPDVVARAGLDAETRLRANKVFGEIGKAYATLADPEKRRHYDLSLAGGGEELDVERLATAEGLFRKGEVLLRQGNFKGALEFLEPAAQLWPDEAEYQSALGWALYKKLPSDPQRAREHLERAAALDPSDANAAQRLSVVLREVGDRDPDSLRSRSAARGSG